jgi:mycoredoxin-dependent peroxiredoxin
MTHGNASVLARTPLRIPQSSFGKATAILAFATLGLALAWIINHWWTRPNTTYVYEPISGRWVFRNKPTGATTHPILTRFQSDWGRPGGDERKVRPQGWKARMTALVELARLGSDLVPVLLGGLDDRDDEVRELSAQMLGYTDDASVVARLDRAIREDPSATVRIYAAVGRSALTGEIPDSLAEEIRANDPSFMVRERVKLTLARPPVPREPTIIETLSSYDLATMNTARLGELAPEFALKELSGPTVRLSDYRGNKNVVLIFAYGVTCFYCTGHLSNFHRRTEEFEAINTQVLVVEANDAYRVSATARVANVPTQNTRLRLLLDPAHTAAATYGVAMQMNHIEWLNRPATFVIDRAGIIRRAYIATSVNDRPTPDDLLRELEVIRSEDAAKADSPQNPRRGRNPVLIEEP